MSRKPASFLAAALLPALLLGAGGAAAVGPVLNGGHAGAPLLPVQMRSIECAGLDVTVELGSGFDKLECESEQTGHGGESARILRSVIVANGPRSEMIVYYDRGGTNTYMDRQSPKAMFESGVDYDVPGSWSPADSSNGFEIARFFADFDSLQVPCFAFARYAGHVARSTGYQHRVIGVYCQKLPGDEPLADARIDQLTGKIKAKFF